MSLASGETRAEANRRIRREALRDQLEAKGLIQQVIETTDKLSNLNEDMDTVQVQRLRAANESRFKLINKYLPDAKEDQSMNLRGALGLFDLSNATDDELDRFISKLISNSED